MPLTAKILNTLLVETKSRLRLFAIWLEAVQMARLQIILRIAYQNTFDQVL